MEQNDSTAKGLLSEGTKRGVGIGVGIIASTGLLGWLDPESVKSFLSETAQSQIAQAGFFFTVAAWLHAGRVKKEIAKNFEALTMAINGASTALRKDLDDHWNLLENHSLRLDNLEKTKPISQGELNV